MSNILQYSVGISRTFGTDYTLEAIKRVDL